MEKPFKDGETVWCINDDRNFQNYKNSNTKKLYNIKENESYIVHTSDGGNRDLSLEHKPDIFYRWSRFISDNERKRQLLEII